MTQNSPAAHAWIPTRGAGSAGGRELRRGDGDFAMVKESYFAIAMQLRKSVFKKEVLFKKCFSSTAKITAKIAC